MFRKAKLIAYIGGVISILLFICVIPGAMALLHVMSEAQFRGWVMALQIWCLLATVIVIVVVPLEEVTLIVAHMRRNTSQKAVAGARWPDDLGNGGAAPGVGFEPQTSKMASSAQSCVPNDGVGNSFSGNQSTCISRL